jgi:hypothetical protein
MMYSSDTPGIPYQMYLLDLVLESVIQCIVLASTTGNDNGVHTLNPAFLIGVIVKDDYRIAGYFPDPGVRSEDDAFLEKALINSV